jgi:hypothetical protein
MFAAVIIAPNEKKAQFTFKMQNEVFKANLFCEMPRHVMSSFFRVRDMMHHFAYDISKHYLLNITKYIDGVGVYQVFIKDLSEVSVHVNVVLLFDTSYSINIPIDDFCESAIIETEQKLLDHFVEKSKGFIVL